MDFTDVGKHCSAALCHQQDFLPFTCDCCHKAFCLEHRTYSAHSCPYAGSKDSRAISCPICKKTIGFTLGEDIHAAFDRHCATDCDPSTRAKRTAPSKCPVKGCRERLTTLNQYTCKKCRATVCLAHRFEDDHQCSRVPPRTGMMSRFFNGTAAAPSPTVVTSKPTTTPNTATATVKAPTPPHISRGPGPGFAAPVRAGMVERIDAASNSVPSSGSLVRITPPSSPRGSPAASPLLSSSSAALRAPPAVGAFGLGLPPAVTHGGHGMNAGPSITSSLLMANSGTAPSTDMPSHAPHLVRTTSSPKAPPVAARAPSARTTGAEFLRQTAAARAQPSALPRPGAITRTPAGPFEESCPTCGQGFQDVVALVNHTEAVHGGHGGSEACPYCSAKFAEVVQLVHHVETAHQSSSSRPTSDSLVSVGPESNCTIM